MVNQNFVIFGRNGVGKSSFINAFFGEQMAPIDHFEACTKLVSEYGKDAIHAECRGAILIDTPGLVEGDGSVDETYLTQMQEYLQNRSIAGYIFVTPLKESRFRPEEYEALQKLTRKLGPKIWSSSWLVFTFAGTVDRNILNERADLLHSEITACLREFCGQRSFKRISLFRKVLLVDNVIANWTTGAQPIAKFFLP